MRAYVMVLRFTGLSSGLRTNKLPVAVHDVLFEILIENFAAKSHQENDVYQTFVALVLSELARVDRKFPYLSAQQCELLATISTSYIADIKD